MCRRGDYETIGHQTFGAASLQHLGSEIGVVGLIDGASGWKEAMELSFANLKIILDPSHPRHHFYDTVHKLGRVDTAAKSWVESHFEQLADGHARKGVADLESECSAHEEEFEAAHRFTPQKMLKIAGACWREETLNPMLSLRVIRANGWWNDFRESEAK